MNLTKDADGQHESDTRMMLRVMMTRLTMIEMRLRRIEELLEKKPEPSFIASLLRK